MFKLFERNDYVLCIDVGYRNIKVLEVERKEDADIYVKKFALDRTPNGAISNGSIRHVDKVAEIIKRLIAKEKIKAKSAKIIMSGTNIITQIFMVDKSVNSDLNTTIMRAINYHLPFVGNDFKVDYKILETIKKDNKEMCRVFVTAVPYIVINSYVNVIRSLNLKPLSIDIPSNSTAKLFSKVKSPVKEVGLGNLFEKTVAVVDFGSETTIFNILENGVLAFNKVILSGSSNIDEHLAKELGISLEEAETIKIKFGMDIPEAGSPSQHLEVFKAIKSYMDSYIKKINNCFDTYQNSSNGKEIDMVFTTGGGMKLKGFNHYLSSTINKPVQPIYNLDLQGIEMSGEIDKEKLIFMTNSLGISI